jgi:hypothetical protein
MFFGLPLDDDHSDETLFARIRHWRTQELNATDWTQLADASCDKATWTAYRQTLRDLPASNKNPRKIVEPTRPA